MGSCSVPYFQQRLQVHPTQILLLPLLLSVMLILQRFLSHHTFVLQQHQQKDIHSVLLLKPKKMKLLE
ncbi:MAG: hypothetical protein CMF72_19775 [Mameliella sp.]|nr:hypothetical protein [Mameliella sp.]